MMFSVQVERRVMALRPIADAKWRYSRVRDDELERLLASEVAWEYEQTRAWHIRGPEAFAAGVLATHEVAQASGRTAAPADWYAVEVPVHGVMSNIPTMDIASYLQRWTSGARAYNAWLDR